jgi:uncharacterized protein
MNQERNKMLLIKTKLDVSPIEGIGLFADEFIGRDTIIWRFQPLIDLRFPREGLSQLSPSAREQISSDLKKTLLD